MLGPLMGVVCAEEMFLGTYDLWMVLVRLMGLFSWLFVCEGCESRLVWWMGRLEYRPKYHTGLLKIVTLVIAYTRCMK